MTRSQSRSLKHSSYWTSTYVLQLLVTELVQHTCPSDFTFSLITRPELLYIYFYLYCFMAFIVHFKLHSDGHQPVTFPVRWHIATVPLNTNACGSQTLFFLNIMLCWWVAILICLQSCFFCECRQVTILPWVGGTSCITRRSCFTPGRWPSAATTCTTTELSFTLIST